MESYKEILIETRNATRNMLTQLRRDRWMKLQLTLILWNLNRMIDLLDTKDRAVKHIREIGNNTKQKG